MTCLKKQLVLPWFRQTGKLRLEKGSECHGAEGAAPIPSPEQLFLASTCLTGLMGPIQPGLFTRTQPRWIGQLTQPAQLLEFVFHCAHWGLASLSQISPRSKSLHGPGPAKSEPQLRGLENRAEPDPSPLLDQETRALRPSGSLKSVLHSLGKAGFFILSFSKGFPLGQSHSGKAPNAMWLCDIGGSCGLFFSLTHDFEKDICSPLRVKIQM